MKTLKSDVESIVSKRASNRYQPLQWFKIIHASILHKLKYYKNQYVTFCGELYVCLYFSYRIRLISSLIFKFNLL